MSTPATTGSIACWCQETCGPLLTVTSPTGIAIWCPSRNGWHQWRPQQGAWSANHLWSSIEQQVYRLTTPQDRHLLQLACCQDEPAHGAGHSDPKGAVMS